MPGVWAVRYYLAVAFSLIAILLTKEPGHYPTAFLLPALIELL